MTEFFLFLDQVFKPGSLTPAQARKIQIEGSQKELEALYYPKEVGVYVGCTFRGKFLKAHTGLKVRPIDWDNRAKEFKKRKHPDWYENNNFLATKLSEIRRKFLNLRIESDEVTADMVKDMITKVLHGKNNEIKTFNFYDIFDIFLKEKAKISKPLTLQKYTILKQHLLNYEKTYGRLSFTKINREFDINFKYWSVNVKKHLNNSISRNIKCVKVFMRWALEQGYHSSLEFEKLKASNDEGTVIALTYEEFMSIANLALTDNPKLDRVRDVFLFQALTGQRYSDIKHIKKVDIKNDPQNGPYWKLYQIKGSKRESIKIPLLDKAVQILEKYSRPNMQPSDPVLPIISLTNFNVYLKEVGKVAQINSLQNKVNYSGLNRVEKTSKKWEMLSSHIARKSFVTLSLQMGMRPEMVRAITGHTTGKMLERYTSIGQNIKTTEMKDIWKDF